MSYCVNCGVELDQSLKHCPLCSTPVINPNDMKDNTVLLPTYPIENVSMIVHKIRFLSATLVSAVLLTALILCPLCDYIIYDTLTWSRYVIPSVIFVWCCSIPPILIRHNKLVTSILIDFIAIVIYLPVMNMLTVPDRDWFMEIALPILAYLFLSFILLDFLSHLPKKNILYLISLGIFLIGFLCVMIEYVILKFINKNIDFIWSLPALISCMSVAVLLIIISRLSKVSSVRKHMHI